MQRLALALGLSLLAAITVASAADDEGFGKTVLGVGLRAEEQPVPIGDTGLMGAVAVDIRNAGDAALLGTRSLAPPRLTADGTDAPPAGLVVVPQIHPAFWPGGSIAAGATHQVVLRYLRTSQETPERVALRAHVWVSRESPAPRRVASPPFDVPLAERRVARRLRESDLPADGNVPVFVIYHDHGGLDGRRALEVHPSGTARAARRTLEDDADDPQGAWRAPLTATEIAALGRALHAGRVWELPEPPLRPLVPDESWVELYVVTGHAALRAEIPLSEAEKRETWPALREHLETLRTRVVARARKGPR